MDMNRRCVPTTKRYSTRFQAGICSIRSGFSTTTRHNVQPAIGLHILLGVMIVLRTTRCLVTALVVAALGGCAQNDELAMNAGVRSGIPGTESGLTLQWWLVDDTNHALGQTLAKYADRPVPMHESVQTLWRENGLRVVSVPEKELSKMRADLWRAGKTLRTQRLSDDTSPNAPSQQPELRNLTRVHAEWLGQRPRWTEIASGPRMPRGAVIALDSGRVRLGPGRVRLLARCWSIPLAGLKTRVPAGLRLELALQWADLDRADRNKPSLEEANIMRAAEDQGLIFSRFVAEMIAVEGEALVIVTDAPDADWNTSDKDASQNDNARIVALPAATLPTLGRALLTNPGVGEYRPGAKVVLVLTPRIPEHYELIRR